MSARRVMGTETEYGVAVLGRPDANPVLTSSQVVNAYAPVRGDRAPRVRWDFEEESPLRDARGFVAHLEPGTDIGGGTAWFEPAEDEVGLANAVLVNGARLYVDHAHPEYSTPETTNARDALLHDVAGERVMLAAGRAAAQAAGGTVLLHKNNTDGKGASYGSHENYLVDRAVPFADLVRRLTPFLVTRQVFTGAGRVGLGQESQEAGFQLSQRADFVEVEVGLETTLKRPIVNTRDEPHADPDKYRRLHVIIGDANLCEVAGLLKLGTAALVLSLVEAGWDGADGLRPVDPVGAVRRVSRDLTLAEPLRLADGRRLTPVEVQRIYLEAAAAHVDERFGTDVDPVTADVLARWGDVLDRLERDWTETVGLLDWATKRRLLEGYRDREGLGWDAPKLALVDLQYHDVRPDKGLYAKLRDAGRVERVLSEEEIGRAVTTPPEDTRAWFRGQCVQRYGAAVAAASWDSVVLDTGDASLQRVPTVEPLRGTRAHVGALLEASPTAADLVRALSGR